MRRGGVLRGAAAAWLGLIALQAVSTQGGTGRVAGFFTDADRLLQRVLDPNVPAIPDRRTATTTTTAAAAEQPATTGGRLAGRIPLPNIPE